MTLTEKVMRLIEERRLDAIKNQIARKMIDISIYLGQEVAYSNTIPESYDDQIPIMDENWRDIKMGHYFDGLNYGVNLNIWTEVIEDKVCEVTAKYNGYLIFKESEGKIVSYAPFKEWMDALEFFTEMATKKSISSNNKKKIYALQKSEKEGLRAINILKMLWGYK